MGNRKNSFHTWDFGTLNIRSGKEKLDGARMYMIAKETARANLSFCCLQEVRHRNTGKKLIQLDTGEQFVFYWCGQKKRRDAGVGILVKSEKGIAINEPDFNNPRVMAINLCIHGFNIRVVIGYSPTNIDGSDGLKDEFYRNMKKACENRNKTQKLIIAGDFNAETSVVYHKSEFDGTKVIEDELCNDNGQRLKSFCRSQRLCIPQSYFEHPLTYRYTWYSCDGKTKKVLDYILLERFVNQYVQDCRVKPDNFESDHRLLVTTLKTPKNKEGRWKPRTTIEPRLNMRLLTEDKYRSDFIEKSKEGMQRWRNLQLTADELVEELTNTLSAAGKEVLPTKQAKQVNQIWKNDPVLNLLLLERADKDKLSNEYKNLTKSIKKRVKKLRNEKIRKEADEINSYATKRQIEALYRSFKDEGSSFKDVKQNDKCDPQKLKEFFSAHFSPRNLETDPIELIDAPEFIRKLQNVPADINVRPPEKEEIRDVLKNMKNGKSSNDIPAIYLKSALESDDIIQEMVKLYDLIWLTKKIPKKWGHSKLVTIWKGATKGKIDDPSAYRGIQIGSSFCKILVVIILERTRKWYEEQIMDQQQGFRSGRGTTEGIYIVKRLQQISHSTKKPIYSLFVDLSAAFDHINRDWLFKSINQRLPQHSDNGLFRLIESLYSYTTTALDGNETDIFETLVGVRQGGPESPVLYNLYMDYVMRIFLFECEKEGVEFVKLKFSIPRSASASTQPFSLGHYGEHIINWVGYADDIVLSFYDIENLQKGINILNNTFSRYQLNINVSKTKTMTFNAENNDADYPNTICKLGETDVENVKVFKYLGSLIQYSESLTGDTEINLRIESAECKYYQHAKKTDELSYRPSNSRDNPELTGTEPPNVCLSNVDTLY